MSIADKIIQKISSLEFKDLLALLATGKLTKEAIDYARKRIRELWHQKRYGVTLNAEEAAAIHKIGSSEAYRRLRDCIGSHWSLYLIRLGLYIVELNDEGRRKLIEKVKEGIYKKYREKGLKIAHMATTGAIISIIEYLSKLKTEKNLNRMDMAKEFDTIIENWDEITLFIKKEGNEKIISRRIIQKMNKRLSIFFVFAYGDASRIPTKVISELNEKEIITKKNYCLSTMSREDKAGGMLYVWVFEPIRKKELFN